MIDNIIISNPELDLTYTFDKDNSEYLLDDEGISIQELKSNYNTYSVYGRLGKLMDEPQLSSGIEITIRGWIIHTMITPIHTKRERLLRFFNPSHKLTLDFGTRTISGYSKSTPIFGATRKTNNEKFCEFQVVIFCPNPAFIEKNSTGLIVRGTAPITYQPPGYTPIQLDDNGIILIDYAGDLPTGIQIQLLQNYRDPTGDTTWSEHGLRLQKLSVNQKTKTYDEDKILYQFMTRDLVLTENRLYISQYTNVSFGWYEFDEHEYEPGQDITKKLSEIDLSSIPEFMELSPGLNAFKLSDRASGGLSYYAVLINFTNYYSYPEER